MCDRVLVLSRGDIQILKVADILFVEKDGRRIAFYTTDGTYHAYGRLELVLEHLGNSFLLCHKNCAINLNQITRFQGQIVTFSNGKHICMGKENAVAARRALRRYFQNQLQI